MGALDSGCFEIDLENGVGWEEEENEATDPAASELESDADAESTRSIEEAVRVLLQGLGEDHQREGLRRTPQRVAKAFRGGTRGYKQNVKDIVQDALFPEAGLNLGTGHGGGAGGLVVVRDINLFSYCESCLLPFSIKCHVGYIPSGGLVVGLSKLSRAADVFARRLQDPKRLASEICAALHSSIKPAGVAVALQCCHMKLPEDHLSDIDSTYSTVSDMHSWEHVLVSSRSGVFKEEESSLWDDFSSLLRLRGVVIEREDTNNSHVYPWCPVRSPEVPLSNGYCARNSRNGKTYSRTAVSESQASMVTAVASILQSLGADPLRKELVGTPCRYVQWLLNFKSSNRDLDSNSLSIQRCAKEGNVDGTNEMQTVLNIPFFSLCEHHLLPFHGVAHIGYLIKRETIPIERSALQSMVHFFARKLQVQERLTRQIAEEVHSKFNDGAMVVVEAHHNCMISRGIEKVGSNTATTAVLGQFSRDSKVKARFLQTIGSNASSAV
ncbi:LOW QUALITY PROTEIN: GTP cyclohydrolase 1-like [Curcuma longa]|uniref:LOW QUALITY PROTEIN: GTP cyclohydrolase 1-like n=1 Tax=Curcuma longa TaxID=136217 RepID=UPI003D9F2E54